MNAVRRAKMALITLATVGLMNLCGPVRAQATFYGSRANFDAAFPGLPTEGFEAGNILPTEGFGIGTNTLDKDTNNAYFSTGSILDGLRLSTELSGGGLGAQLDLFGGATGYANGDGTKIIAKAQGSDSLDLTLYNNNVNEIGFDLGEGLYTVAVFNGTNLLRTDIIDIPTDTFQFLGYAAIPTITRVNIDLANGVIDNISFGTDAVAATPEPGSIALVGSLGLVGLGFLRRRFRRK